MTAPIPGQPDPEAAGLIVSEDPHGRYVIGAQGAEVPDEAARPWVRPFRIAFVDGFVIEGAQFPSGRCVTDVDDFGFWRAATSFAELPDPGPYATVTWADGGDENGPVTP